jgi:hypothetical protein
MNPIMILILLKEVNESKFEKTINYNVYVNELEVNLH